MHLAVKNSNNPQRDMKGKIKGHSIFEFIYILEYFVL